MQEVMKDYCWVCQLTIEHSIKADVSVPWTCNKCSMKLERDIHAQHWFAAGMRIAKEKEIRRRM